MRRQSWVTGVGDLALALGALALVTAGFGRLEEDQLAVDRSST